MKRSFLFALAVTLLAACSTKEIDIQTPTQDDVVFYASFEQPSDIDTRVYANEDLLLRWTADDRVSIFNKLTYNQEYKFTGQTGANAGGFKKVDNDEFVTGNAISHVVSVYPYQEATTITESEVIDLTLPAEQKYAENTFGLGANTMVSVSEDNVLQYKNVGGYLMLKLYGEGVSVSSITLKGNNGEKLAGKASIMMPQGGVPTAKMANDATTEITLTCATPVQLGATEEEITQFWFVVPPVTFSKGFTVSVINTSGDVFVKSTSRSITIERNTMSKMSQIKVDDAITGSQIVYTSSDGNVVIPNDPDAFDATIVSNEYKDGYGVITFNKELTIIGYEAFSHCTSLQSITFPDGVTTIGYAAFSGCTGLVGELIFPDSLIVIGDHAFNGCSGLTGRLTLPEGVTRIGAWAFYGCSGLSSIFSWAKTPPTGNQGMFAGALGGLIYVPAASVKAYRTADYWSYYHNFIRSIPNPVVGPYTFSDVIGSYSAEDVYQLAAFSEWIQGKMTMSIEEGSSPFLGGNIRISCFFPEVIDDFGENRSLEFYCDFFPDTGAIHIYSDLAFAYNEPGAFDWTVGDVNGEDLHLTLVEPGVILNEENFVFYADGSQVKAWTNKGIVFTRNSMSSVPVPEVVDMGLSVKWASFNLGASKPEAYGDYYAWGETEPYYSSQDPLTWKEGKEAGYDAASYKWCKGSMKSLTKYCTDSNYGYIGFTDGKAGLEPEDDAAHVNLGGNWRMPTNMEWTELMENCTWTQTTQNGLDGWLVTAANGNSIFLPAAGNCFQALIGGMDYTGCYWSSSLNTDFPNGAWFMYFNSDGAVIVVDIDRSVGFTVRPVYAE